MKIIIFFLSCALSATPVFSCINQSGTTLDGEKTSRRPLFYIRELKRSLDAELKKRGAEMEERLRGGTGFSDQNDYAVALIFLGRNEEAISLLQELEKEKSGEYATAANLGTAYELSGQNEL